MKAVTWQGRRSVSVEDVEDPIIKEPNDAIIKVTSTNICGSDLHALKHAEKFVEVSKRAGALVLLLLFAALPVSAGVAQVKLKLPLKPRLPLRGNEKIALAPFVIATEAEKARDKRLQNVDLQAEFQRFLKKQIEKKTKLEIVELPTELKLPTQNLSELGRSTEFWRALGTQTGAEIVVSGSLEFRVEDRSGYKTEEYVSPIDGRTYYRQVYVEQTGFLFDIVFLVFDGRSGEKILQDEFKDFRQTGGRRADELQGLFENLFSLENQIQERSPIPFHPGALKYFKEKGIGG
jgi:hypothetical protein